MRGTAAFLPVKNKVKQIYPIKGAGGMKTIAAPKKKGNNDDFVKIGPVMKSRPEPIIAFSKPPPIPPVMGPLVALSLLETWYSRDTDED